MVKVWYLRQPSDVKKLEMLLTVKHQNDNTNLSVAYLVSTSSLSWQVLEMLSDLKLSWSSIPPASRRSRVRIPLKPWYFSGVFHPIAFIGKFTAMITLHFQIQSVTRYVRGTWRKTAFKVSKEDRPVLNLTLFSLLTNSHRFFIWFDWCE